MAKVKICGIKDPKTARQASDLGFDALGLVFYPQSKRAINISQAQEIIKALPPFISIVGLFVNQDKNFIFKVLNELQLDILQFHGTETNDFCQQFNKRWIKAVPMKGLKNSEEVFSYLKNYPDACAFLLDAFNNEEMGGSGKQFNYEKIPQNMEKPWILAGGLDEKNVYDLVKKLKPYGVDVSSGVEDHKGNKSFAKMCDFIFQSKTAFLL